MMNDLWAKYEDWLKTHFPEGMTALNPGAREYEINALETAIGVRLPEDYRTCLRISQWPRAGCRWTAVEQRVSLHLAYSR